MAVHIYALAQNFSIATEGDTRTLTMIDDGVGIPDSLQHSVFEPKNMSAYELHRETTRAYSEFYSTPRIFGQFARGKIVPGLVMAYGRRVFRRLARVNTLFVEGLRNGSNGSGGNGSGSDSACSGAGAEISVARPVVTSASAR